MSKNSTMRDSKINSNHLNILIIDDNEQITKMLTTFLELKNHNCRVANDGKQGLALIPENKHEILIYYYQKLLNQQPPKYRGIS